MWANTYLVKTGDDLNLIDTGSGSEKSNADLAAGLAQAGFRFEDLTQILLTHGHIDHFGGLVYLRERTDAPIGVHELDLQTVAHHEERLALMTRRVKAFLSQAGVPDEHRDELIQMYRFTKVALPFGSGRFHLRSQRYADRPLRDDSSARSLSRPCGHQIG